MARTAVLLDLDGTLTDSWPGIVNSVRHALRQLGHPALDDASLRSFVGPPLWQSFAALGLDSDLAVAAYREYFNERGITELTVYPGIPEVLDELAGRGFALALATSKPTVYAERILAATGLGTHIGHVHGAGLDGTNSRKQDVVGQALSALGIEPAAAVMVGDRSHDIEGAAAHGVDTIGVLWGYGSAGELEGAWALAEKPADLLSLLA